MDPTPANDAELTVLDVIEEENHETIQQSECIHSIPVIEITDTNSEVYNASGVIYPPTTTGPGAPVKLKMMSAGQICRTAFYLVPGPIGIHSFFDFVYPLPPPRVVCSSVNISCSYMFLIPHSRISCIYMFLKSTFDAGE